MLQKSPTRECYGDGTAAHILPGAGEAEGVQNKFTQCREVAALPGT